MKSVFKAPDGKSYLIPFILVSCLFLMWGFAHGLLDVLNKHFQNEFTMSKSESGFVQLSTYIAYGILAFPAGMFMRRFGYQKGIILGLVIFAVGAFCFYPAAIIHSPTPFLISLFIIACGLCILETAANPYSTVLGPQESASRRLNLSQSLNGLGWVLGPFIGGKIIFGVMEGDTMALAMPYMLVGACVIVVMLFFLFIKLPDIKESNEQAVDTDNYKVKPLWSNRHFVLAFVSQILYMVAQTGIFALFINYVLEAYPVMGEEAASKFLAFGGMALFMLGRLSGSFLMAKYESNKLLAIYAVVCVICMLLVIMNMGIVSMVALCTCFFFMSIMFPTIFALGLTALGEQTKKGASFLTAAVAGGAPSAIIMGYVGADSMALGFAIPMLCFVFIAYFGMNGYKVR